VGPGGPPPRAGGARAQRNEASRSAPSADTPRLSAEWGYQDLNLGPLPYQLGPDVPYAPFGMGRAWLQLRIRYAAINRCSLTLMSAVDVSRLPPWPALPPRTSPCWARSPRVPAREVPRRPGGRCRGLRRTALPCPARSVGAPRPAGDRT